jgi:hypothetical protein
MPGLRQPLSAHIQQIRNDLRERYKGGFPILKELLQNADDAGGGTPGASASEMVLLLANGIPNSRHILLRTPGLCVVNDGDFTAGSLQVQIRTFYKVAFSSSGARISLLMPRPADQHLCNALRRAESRIRVSAGRATTDAPVPRALTGLLGCQRLISGGKAVVFIGGRGLVGGQAAFERIYARPRCGHQGNARSTTGLSVVFAVDQGAKRDHAR